MRKWLVNARGAATQSDIATKSGISQQMYSAIENGRANPSVATAVRIANVLGFPWERFFSDDVENRAPTANASEA